MRVVVDYDRCESNAICMGMAPEVFEVRDDDNLYVLQENPPEELRVPREHLDHVASWPQRHVRLEVEPGPIARGPVRLIEGLLHSGQILRSTSG